MKNTLVCESEEEEEEEEEEDEEDEEEEEEGSASEVFTDSLYLRWRNKSLEVTFLFFKKPSFTQIMYYSLSGIASSSEQQIRRNVG